MNPGVILGKPRTYTPEGVRELTRADLRLVAMDLGIEGADEWVHPYWNGSGKGRYKRRAVWRLKRAAMIAKIEEAIR